jgi:hypothetical protein
MVRSLGVIVRLTLRSNASVPFRLGFISALRSFLALALGLSDLLTDPGVLSITSFPSRLFLRKGFVLPHIGVPYSHTGIAASGAMSQLLQDRHD